MNTSQINIVKIRDEFASFYENSFENKNQVSGRYPAQFLNENEKRNHETFFV
jgi:hypothetical protein